MRKQVNLCIDFFFTTRFSNEIFLFYVVQKVLSTIESNQIQMYRKTYMYMYITKLHDGDSFVT